MTEIPKFTSETLRTIGPDGSVKVRSIEVPSEETRWMHTLMLNDLKYLDIPMPHATGAVPGKSLMDNVLPHRENDIFYMLDLADAFPNVDIEHLRSVLRSPIIPKRYQADVEDFLDNWAVSPNVSGLPLGAPASPYLFNLSMLPLDRQLSVICGREGVTYTRYLDDLTFSAPEALGKNLRRRLREPIQEHPGAKINHRKSQLHSLQNGPVTVTGISIYPPGDDGERRLAPSPALIDKVRRHLGEIVTAQQNGVPVYHEGLAELHGYMGAISQMTSGRETQTIRALKRDYDRVRASAQYNVYEMYEGWDIV